MPAASDFFTQPPRDAVGAGRGHHFN